MGNVCAPSFSCDACLSRCLDCSVTRARYVYDLRENLAALRRELATLRAIREDVKMRILVAEQKQMRRREQVQEWLSRVQDEESQVAQIITQGRRLSHGGVCSMNYRSNYRFGKTVFKKLSQVQSLKNQGDRFKEEDVAQLVPVNPVDELPLPPIIVGLQSTFDSVWRCLVEEQLGIVGLYGIGGVGKTTLLSLINNKFLDTQNQFDFVIWVVVSKDLQPEKIQETIAKKIGLFNESWNNKSLHEKAQEIFKIMKNKKYVLLFDDIWEPVDLAQVGLRVPSRTYSESNKIIFTTRELDVCSQMETHKIFKVECLSYEDAWKLFEEKVRSDTLDSHPDIPELAETVAKECGGLPLALITVGRAMTSKKTPREWEHAIEVLRSSAAKFSGMVNRVFSRLKLSYDFLSSDAIRISLLYCSLFPEDHKIFIEDLIDCWICEEFLDEYDGIRARQEGYSIIRTLVDACLLEEIGDDGVKMHDVIRDMALWIASTSGAEKERILVLAGAGLSKAPMIEMWKDVKRMSLMNNKIHDLGDFITSPRLMTLFLSSNILKGSSVSSNFFQSLAFPSLRVLKLSHTTLSENLLIEISLLVFLQHLDLSDSLISYLPLEFRRLVNLKCLNLENTSLIRKIPSYLISNLKMLRSLRMFGCGRKVNQEEDSILHRDNSRVLVGELLGLEHLNTVSLTLHSFQALERLLKSPAVSQTTRIFFRNCERDSQLVSVFSIASLRHLQVLEIGSCHSGEIISDYRGRVKEIRDIRGFRSLHEIVVSHCPMIRHLTWLILAPNLKVLDVSYCHRLEEIISCEELGELTAAAEMENLCPFGRLESLILYSCSGLKSIHSVALAFPHLKEISASTCLRLKKLPFDCKITAASLERKFVIKGSQGWWNGLQWDDEPTRDAFLPFFKSIN